MNAELPIVVEAQGLRCPLPIIRLAAAAARHPHATIVLHSTDPASCTDVPAWGRLRGYEVVSTSEDDTQNPAVWTFTVHPSATKTMAPGDTASALGE